MPTVSALDQIDLAPSSREKEILQNVAVLLSTPKMSVPMDRGLGSSMGFLDRPAQAARALMISEIAEAVAKYEPRAQVERVSFREGETHGSLIPVVEVSIVHE